jgi:hypothetical protein
MLGAIIFGLVCVLLFWAYQQRKKPSVEQTIVSLMPKIELTEVGASNHSIRFRYPKSPYERIELTLKERIFILNRDKKTCQICGAKAPAVILEIDHIIPVSKGGTNDPANLQVLCFDCNRGKGVDLLQV